MNTITRCFYLIICISATLTLSAQEDLLKGIEDSTMRTQKVQAAFKSTRVINAHSMEMLKKGNLDFRILHRFGPFKSGIDSLFGLDDANMRIAFDYGVSDNLMIGGGRSSLNQEFDAFAKVRLLQQAKGSRQVPLSILVAAGYLIYTQPSVNTVKRSLSDRSAYYVQLIAGRKFSEAFSLQLSPILIHRNLVEGNREAFRLFEGILGPQEKTVAAMGVGGRLKLSKRFAITFDWHHPFDGIDRNVFTDPVSVGVDIETGGHVFQLHFSNSVGMNELTYLTETRRNDIFGGGVRFGFNLSRIFQLKKRSM